MSTTTTVLPRLVRNRWTGLIGHLHREAEDGRSLALIHVDDLPLPLLYAQPGADYYDTEVRGGIEAVAVLPDHTVRAEGWTTLPVGTYRVGMDLSRVTLGRGENPWHEMRGVLAAVTVADDDHIGGSWDDVQITVVPA